MTKEHHIIQRPESRSVGVIAYLVVDGEEIEFEVSRDSILEGEDRAGIKLQITRPGVSGSDLPGKYKWRYLKDEGKDNWSEWTFTYFSPSEKINDLEKDSPTIAQVYKALRGGYRGFLPYSELWRIYGSKGE